VDIRGSQEREGAYETWSKVNGELFRCFYCFPLLAFRLVFRGNLELIRIPLSFGTRCARKPSVHLYRVRGGVSPTYEGGDKVTLRNCFPRADEGELFPARAASLAHPVLSALSSLPSTKSNSLLVCYSAISSCCTLQTHLFPTLRSRPVLFHKTSISARRRVEDLREVEGAGRSFTQSLLCHVRDNDLRDTRPFSIE